MSVFAEFPLTLRLLKAFAYDNGGRLAEPAELTGELRRLVTASEEDLVAAGDNVEEIIEYLVESESDPEGPNFAPAPRASSLLGALIEGEFPGLTVAEG